MDTTIKRELTITICENLDSLPILVNIMNNIMYVCHITSSSIESNEEMCKCTLSIKSTEENYVTIEEFIGKCVDKFEMCMTSSKILN